MFPVHACAELNFILFFTFLSSIDLPINAFKTQTVIPTSIFVSVLSHSVYLIPFVVVHCTLYKLNLVKNSVLL